MHRFRRALVLALAVSACRAPERDARELPRAPASTPSSPASSAPVTPSPADSLRLTLDVPREVAAGEAVPLVLRIESLAARPLDLYLQGRDVTFDVVVTAADGREVWRRLEGEVIQAVVRLQPIAPGETIERRATWDQRTREGRAAPPGDYRLRALLLTEGPEPLATASVPLRIVRR